MYCSTTLNSPLNIHLGELGPDLTCSLLFTLHRRIYTSNKASALFSRGTISNILGRQQISGSRQSDSFLLTHTFFHINTFSRCLWSRWHFGPMSINSYLLVKADTFQSTYSISFALLTGCLPEGQPNPAQTKSVKLETETRWVPTSKSCPLPTDSA